MLTLNYTEIDRILSDNLSYGHFTGVTEIKEAYACRCARQGDFRHTWGALAGPGTALTGYNPAAIIT